MHLHRTPAILVVLLSLTLAARAEPAVSVEVGWGNTYRAGRWNPVYVTAESSPPREVIAQVEGMHSPPRAMLVGNRFALSPSPSTHAIYLPLGESNDVRDTMLTLRDGTTLKRIAAVRLALTPPVQQAPLEQLMIGVSGDPETFGMLKDQFAGDATVGYVPPPYLSVVAAGYDALDVLMLNSPDLSKVREDQQRPIVEWLRAGGTLVMWPGTTAIPPAGPLIDVLPAAIGDNQLITLDPAAVERAGWTRVGRVHARQLTPVPDAEAIALAGPAVTAYRRAVGFGQVVIAPIDLSAMRFNAPPAVMEFWKSILDGVPDRTRDGTPDVKTTRWLRDTVAPRTRYVPAWLLIGLVIAGPVDSLLLKLLGRRPWTVVTVLSWVGLLAATTLALSIRNRERPVEYRSVRFVEEVDRAGAIVTDLVALRRPAGTGMAGSDERGAWWQPAHDPTDAPASPRSEFHADQSEGGTWPARFSAHLPTPRVLQAQRWTASPSIIDAFISIRNVDGQRRVVGTLVNRGERPLADVRIRVADGIARYAGSPIAPGASVDISAPIDAGDRSLDIPPAERFFEDRRSSTAPVAAPDYVSLEGFAFGRSTRLSELLRRGDRACLYARIVDPAPPAELPAATRHKHLAFVRSLVRLDFKLPETPATGEAAR